jgi:hypothetical protein
MAKTLVQQGVKSTNNSLKGHTMILSHINYFNFIHNNRKANKITLTNHFFSIKLAKKKLRAWQHSALARLCSTLTHCW